MKKQAWLALFNLALIAAFALSACGGAPTAAPAPTSAPAAQPTTAPAAQPTTAPAAQAVTIRWRTRPDNKAEQDVYQQISDDLSKQLQPQGITLQYDPAPVTGYFDKLTTEFSAGNAPDVVWIAGANTGDYAPKGVLLDLAPIAKADTSFKLTDYYDVPMKELTQGGHLWGLPRDISTLVMFYNKDLFKGKGLTDPADEVKAGNWTWDTFRKDAVALTDTSKKVYGFSFSDWWGLWGWFADSAGGSLFNADRTMCALNSDASQKGLQFMSDLFLKDKVSTAPGVEGGASETTFVNGQVGMFPNGRWFVPSMRQNAKFDWGVVEMPVGPGGIKSTWLFWGAYEVSAKTKYPQQAWTVIKALTSPDVQAKVAALGTNIPSNKAQSAVDAFLNSKPPADNQPFIAGASYAQAEMTLVTGSWGDIGGAYQTQIDNILQGKATVADATKAACDKANPMFTK
jgi:multiple sugar transport system substrate-binding protein